MSRHRGEPPRYQARYGRVAVLAASLTTTAVALLGGVGVLPSAADDHVSEVAGSGRAIQARTASETVVQDPVEPADDRSETAAPAEPTADTPVEPTDETSEDADPAPLPTESGEGRRAVFSESQQRVWLVDGDEQVLRTYPVSGSLTDNLDPGTFEVFSRSADALGIDGSTMNWFVRFTRGPTGAAIGFHDIPVKNDAKVQTPSELGTPLSHGCIRQKTADAVAMWDFARMGTAVVVTA